MNDFGQRQTNPLLDALQGREGVGARPPARLRIGAIAAGTAMAVAAVVAIGAVPGLAHAVQDLRARQAGPTPAPAQRVTTVQQAPAGGTPTPQQPVVAGTDAGTVAPATVSGAPAAQPAASAARTAAPPVTFASQLTVGPGAGGFAESGQWTADGRGGVPGFSGPDAWTTSPQASARWSLGSPGGGQRWDQVRVRVWIPNLHAGAWVRYTVTSTAGGAQAVRTFDVPQDSYSGWYTLPATFSAGTTSQRTGTIGSA